MPEVLTKVWAGPVVVGGGVAGLLVARELVRRGLSPLVLEGRSLAGGQTAHAHGWLHRGHIFPDADEVELNDLSEGADWWDVATTRLTEEDVSRTAVISFGDERSARSAARRWKQLGLEFESMPVPDGIKAKLSFRSPEAAISPVMVLRRLMDGEPVAYHAAAAARIERTSDGSVESLHILEAGRPARIAGHSYVFAAGNGLPPLLARGVGGDSAAARRSHMLVVKSSIEMPSAYALPEQDPLGLFAVQRRTADASRILMSNFVSYAGSDLDGVAARFWRRGMARSLSTYTPDLWNDPDALWGEYRTTKTEMRRGFAMGVPGSGLVDIGASNAVAVLPGKLTLAPLVAAEAARRVAEFPRNRPVDGPAVQTGAVPWSNEDWEMTPLLRRATYFEEAS